VCSNVTTTKLNIIKICC